jgi:hypothetical protein
MGFSQRCGRRERHSTQELAVTVSKCWQLARVSFGVEEFFELRFGEDGYAQGFGFV